MGAWGTGYKDCDNYYNEAPEFVKPLTDALKVEQEKALDGIAKYNDYHGLMGDFRARLMWTANILRSTTEQVSITSESFDVLVKSVDLIRESAPKASEGWRDPSQFLATITTEMDSVQEWLEEFTPSAFLSDRIGALTEAIEGHDGNGPVNATS